MATRVTQTRVETLRRAHVHAVRSRNSQVLIETLRTATTQSPLITKRAASKIPSVSYMKPTDKLLIARGNVLSRSDFDTAAQVMYPTRLRSNVPDLNTFPESGGFRQDGSLVALSGYGVILKRRARGNTTGGIGAYMRRPLPAGSWVVSSQVARIGSYVGSVLAGMYLYESATRKHLCLSVGGAALTGIACVTYATEVSQHSFIAGLNAAAGSTDAQNTDNAVWLRFALVGSDIVMSWSVDGVMWIPHHVIALTTAFTTAPDKVGFFLDPRCTVLTPVSNNFGIAVKDYWETTS